MTKPSIIWRALGTQAFAAATLALVEMSEHSVAPSAVVSAASLGLAVGVAIGTGVACSLSLLGVAPRLSRWALALYSIAMGVALSDHMGIVSALGGHARTLALVALVVTTTGSVALGVLLMGVARTSAYPDGFLLTRARFTWVPLLLVGLLVLIGAHVWVPSYYRAVQNVGASAAGMLVGVALQIALGSRPLPSSTLRFATLVGAILLASTPVGLHRPSDALRVALDAAPLPRVGLSILRRATDVDGDGYSAMFGGGDCNPWNARIHPGAREIPENGIDDNCQFGDAPKPRTEEPAPASAASGSPLSVVLLTIDTLRSDRVEKGALGPSLTPNLDAWARGARSFDHAYTASTRTCSSVASFLYGATPFQLAWVDPDGSQALRRLRQRLPTALLHVPWMCVRDEGEVPGRKSLATLLRARGMETVAVVDDSFTYLLQRELFGEGFERYEDEGHLTDEPVIARAISVLGELATGDRRFFLWVHVFGPHDRGTSDQGADVVREYDAAVSRTDRLLAPLFEALDAASRRTPMAAIALSDHGELFGPHHRWHGTDLSEELLKVPLLIRAPGLQPGGNSTLVSTIDVLPTCLALTGTPLPHGLAGMNLAAEESELRERRTLFSDVWNQHVGYSLTAAYDGSVKLVYDHLLGTFESSMQGPALGGSVSRGSLPPSAPALRAKLDQYLHDNELHFAN